MFWRIFVVTSDVTPRDWQNVVGTPRENCHTKERKVEGKGKRAKTKAGQAEYNRGGGRGDGFDI